MGISLLLGGAAQANPEGGTVVSGSATIVQEPGQTLIQQHSDRAIINWQNFSIGAGELTRFMQPSAAAVALNRVTGDQVSNILGRLEANGQVYLINPNGIVFGPNAVVDLAGLIASTHDIRDQDFLAGQLDFTIPGQANARILNQGLITAAEGGLVALVAPSVANSGVIQARLGQVVIAGTNAATIDPYGDDLIVFRADSQVVEALTDPDNNPLAALVDISGEITADGGRVLITANMARGVVNSAIDMTGIVQARSIAMQNGEIVLNGGDSITNIAGTLDATGTGPDETGGTIEVASDVVMHTGTLDTSGGGGGSVSIDGRVVFNQGRILADGVTGTGGEIHIQSARSYLDVSASVTSAMGAAGGGDIVIDGGPEGTVYSSGQTSVASSGGAGGTLDLLARDITLVAANLDASGATGGGTIRVGGDFQGGGDLPHAETVYVSSATTIAADAMESGDGGTVILWSDRETLVGGSISARGGDTSGDGGLIEISSADAAAFAGTADAAAPQGQAGELLLDPKNITIDDTTGMFPQFDLVDPLPGAGNTFGSSVVSLSTGNVVVADQFNDSAATDAGAVHLFDGTTGALISTLTGSTSGDGVGKGIVTLTNGNFVIRSPDWDNGATGGAGAATWVSGTTGLAGAVSTANSLYGTTVGDQVGQFQIQTLTNGNYVVLTSNWDNGAIVNAGAVTWGNGTTGITGAVSTANSLYGTTASDIVGNAGVVALTNGNYVVQSPAWDDGAISGGAVTWGNGTTGITGAVSTTNSLYGTTSGDGIGTVVVALTNGNYVTGSWSWDNGGIVDAGVATWGNGTTGITGAVSTANSLYGTTANERVTVSGSPGGIVALTNGNYVVRTIGWDNGGATDAGAVTWGDGTTGITGAVSTANSLYGTTASDKVGQQGVTALTNGNYLVRSSGWDNGGTADAGAVTWGDGTTGITGAVSTVNSLHGTTASDQIGRGGVTALTNGNYVVASQFWDNGAIVDAGAVTWGNGTTGITGVVSVTNSLHGTTAGDSVGNNGVTALTNGNYVVGSRIWNNGAVSTAGAATWGDGTTGITGAVSTANSLYGTTTGDKISQGGITALANGNYVVSSTQWANGGASFAGAVTWGNGAIGTTGAVTVSNSVVGSSNADNVGAVVETFADGNFITWASGWDNGGITGAGAVTFVNGTTGQTLDGSNVVSAQNSVIGQTATAGLSTVIVDNVNNSFLVRFTANGGRVVTGLTDLSQITFDRGSLSGMVLPSAILTATLDAGTAVTLQASNDITINSAITVNNGGGNGGALTLQAGRSILVNADIFTDNGNLSLFANNLLANGVIDAQRDIGAAVIAMAAGTTLDAGTGNVNIELHDGTGKTNTSSGDITLGNVNGATVTVKNLGPTAGSDILMASGAEAITANTVNLDVGTGNDITLDNAGNDFASVAIAAARNVILVVANALDFAASTISGFLNATAGGAITDSGNLTVAGATTLATSTSVNISLDSIGNDFNSVGITSAKDVTLVDTNALNLTTSTVSGTLDATAGGALSGGNVTVQALKVAGTSVALTGSIAGAADQAAANSITLTSLGGGPYTFNGFTIGAVITDPATDAAVAQQAAQIGALSEETTTAPETVIGELTSESTTTELIVTEPLDSGGSTDTTTETTTSEQTVAAVEEVMVEDSIVEAVEYINGEGDVSLADQQEFFLSLDGTEIVDGLLSSDDPTAQSIGQVFEEIAGGAEISQSEMKSQLQEMGVSGGKMLSYLGLFARVQKQARTEMLQAAIAALEEDPSVAEVPVEAPGEGRSNSEGAGRKIAVLFGIDDYREPIPNLTTPTSDVEAVAALLESKLGYETRILKNATKTEMIEALQALVNELNEEDSLIIFYAGHGYILETNGVGYWLAADATYDSAENWLSNKNVSEFLNAMRAKNIMLIADSCYAGSLLSGEQKREGVQVRLNREELKDKRSVVILSSGGEEPVQDDGGEGHSVFARQLMTVLEGMNADSVGIELYEEVKARIAQLAPQVPQYGGIISAGHEAGADHLFDLGS